MDYVEPYRATYISLAKNIQQPVKLWQITPQLKKPYTSPRPPPHIRRYPLTKFSTFFSNIDTLSFPDIFIAHSLREKTKRDLNFFAEIFQN